MTERRILADAQTLAQAVAEQLVERLARVQAEGRVPSIVLTGGTIAGEIYRSVAQLPRDRVDWTQVDFWWGDERYVPADSTDRNDRGVELDLLDVVGADPARVHAMPAADESHPDVTSAAAAYARTVATHAPEVFDLVLLGLGPDGHVASLFPGFPQLDVLDEVAVAVTGSPKPPPQRISLTFPTLGRAEEVWFVVSGQDKADAVSRALAEDGSVHETPARGVTGEHSVWWLDEPASSAL
jgi:6-phosphogluconolactonase